ncbi:MAG: PEP-CTERM system TPR-repeat protein PrsT [Proteobacteria bacterium]|nr:PEP-CTERM system TPR-repeat protein PrsT [Pseudomonadota bacterium]
MMATACLLSAGMALAAKSPKPTDRQFELAIELIAAGDHKGGIAELKTALETDPTDLAARVLLGNTYLEIEDGAAAAEEFLQARKDGAGDSFVLAPLGRAYVLQGRYEEALTELSKAGPDQSTAAEVAVIRGDAHLALRHFSQAEQNYLEALKIRTKFSKALNGLARVKIATDNLISAGNYVERALKAKPEDGHAWFAKGEIARLQRREDEALTHFNRAVDLAPRFVPPRLARARILIGRGAYRDAEPDVLHLRGRDAKDPHAAFLQSLILAHAGKVKEAQDVLIEAETALKGLPAGAAPSDPPTLLLLGVVSYFRQDYASAYRHLTAYLKRVPEHMGAHKLLASLALSTGDSDYALHLLEKLALRHPMDIEILTLYGDALMRTHNHGKAIKVLEKAASIADPGYSALSRLVMLRSVAGQNGDAKKLLRSDIRRDRQAVQATLLMAAAQLNQREYNQALEIANIVIEHDSRNSVSQNLAGSAHVGLKNIDAARRSFTAAVEAAPKYVLAASNLAKLEFSLGNVSAAERLYSYMVEQDSGNGAAMMALAEIELMRDDLDSALSWLKKARKKSRTPHLAALQLVDLYIYANKPDKALSVARDLNSQDPANLTYLTALGRARLAAKRVELAAVTFKEVGVRAAEMKSVDWLVRNVMWQMRAFDEQGARTSLQKALELDDKNLSVHTAFFNLEMAADKMEAALARAETLAALHPRSPAGHMLQGDAHMRMGKFESALLAYEEALKKSPNFPLAARVYRARRAAGREALAFAKGWSAQRPADRDAQRLLAMAYGDAGRDAEAMAVYESLLNATPKDTLLLTSMALLHQKHDASRALDFAERAFRAAPSAPAVMDIYGWILVQQGSLDEGLTLLRKAKLRAPALPEIRYHIAVALNKMGNPEDARQELHAALKTGQFFDGAGEARQLLGKLAVPQQ